jgi:hypothetical protein
VRFSGYLLHNFLIAGFGHFLFPHSEAVRGRADFSDANDEVIQTGFTVQNGPQPVVAGGTGFSLAVRSRLLVGSQ